MAGILWIVENDGIRRFEGENRAAESLSRSSKVKDTSYDKELEEA